MTRYLLHTPTRTGPWRPTKAEAIEDAIAAGCASRDPWPGANTYFEPWAEIETDEPTAS